MPLPYKQAHIYREILEEISLEIPQAQASKKFYTFLPYCGKH